MRHTCRRDLFHVSMLRMPRERLAFAALTLAVSTPAGKLLTSWFLATRPAPFFFISFFVIFFLSYFSGPFFFRQFLGPLHFCHQHHHQHVVNIVSHQNLLLTHHKIIKTCQRTKNGQKWLFLRVSKKRLKMGVFLACF
jgi:hypothetical protein